MSPPLTPSKRTRSREESSHFTRFKHALSTIANNARKHDLRHDKDHLKVGRDIDDNHYNTHSTVHSYISSLKLKLRRIHGPSTAAADAKGIFRFRALDRKKLKSPRSAGSDSMASDRYVFGNAQTISNDSTDRRLIRMLVDKAPSPAASIGSYTKRRSSFGSTRSFSRSLLSVGPMHRPLRRYSMAGSDLTVASEDLTAREFAEHLGINVYPEDDDEEVFGGSVSILVQQHHLQANAPQSTVLSSTRSTKSKVGIMEDTFWLPPTTDSDKSDEEAVPRSSSDSTDAFSRPYNRERRNSLITFAENPSVCKHKQQASTAAGVRPGRHSAPIPIPARKPILVQQNQQSKQSCNPRQSDTLFSVSSESTDSSFASYSTVSSVSTTTTIPYPPRSPPSPKRTDFLETPQIFAIIKNGLPTDPTSEHSSNIPVTWKKGRFEITLGDAPPPEFPPSRRSADSAGDGSCSATTSVASSPAEEKFVVFQRRKYRPDIICDDEASTRCHFEERRRSLSMSVIE